MSHITLWHKVKKTLFLYAGASTNNATKTLEQEPGLSSGTATAAFRTPDKGRVFIYFKNSGGDILFFLTIHFERFFWNRKLELNHKKADQSSWPQEPTMAKGFPYASNKTVRVSIEITPRGYVISANRKKIADYTGLPPPVHLVTIGRDREASRKTRFVSLGVHY